jgi:hypothetical protein
VDGTLVVSPAASKPIDRMSLEEVEAELARIEEERRLEQVNPPD